MNDSIIHALDFDGVLCDSAVETGMSGWKAARLLWSDMPRTIPDDKIEQFRRVRPIIETGYEAILAMRLLHAGIDCDELYSDYEHHIQALLDQSGISIDQLKQHFGATRDAWIAAAPDEWAAMNPLFDGVADKLNRLPAGTPWYVVTTKQERFVSEIFKANAIALDANRIFGLDRKLGKPDVLRQLKSHHPEQTLHFVEDRLPTLLNVRKQPDLSDIRLSFATWGYNTASDKAAAAREGFSLVTLDDFLP